MKKKDDSENDCTQNLQKTINMIFENCPDGVAYKNKNLEYVTANKAFCECFNINNINKKGLDFLSQNNQKLVNEVNNEIISEKCSINYVMNLDYDSEKILNITSTPIYDNDVFLGILSIVKDITQEEITKEKFVFKHCQLESLLENIPMIIYMQDRNLNFIAGTKTSQNFVKEGYDSFSKTKINRLYNKTEEEEENKFVIDNNQIIVKEKEFVGYNDSSHWYKVYKVPINDFNGNVTGIITLANNIDAEKQLQAQRETFVASLGHDLKNPTIAQIRGLELLLKGDFGSINNEQRELLEMVLDSCKYMNGMLSSLLATYRNYGGVVKLNFEEFCFCELIQECVSEMLYVAKDKNISISINNSFKRKTIFADRVQIKRVVMNLLSNGIKYAFKESDLKLMIYEEEKSVCFKFENKSPYIPVEKQKSIFAQYVSYAAAHNELGIGLGLYASKKIIDGHFGEIFVTSFQDNRNIFGFKIPVEPKELSTKELCF